MKKPSDLQFSGSVITLINGSTMFIKVHTLKSFNL